MSALASSSVSSTAKAVVAVDLWTWINNNPSYTVHLKFWFVDKSFQVKDLHPVFEMLLGPDPVSSPTPASGTVLIPTPVAP